MKNYLVANKKYYNLELIEMAAEETRMHLEEDNDFTTAYNFVTRKTEGVA